MFGSLPGFIIEDGAVRIRFAQPSALAREAF
jgi:hypothetical protein